MTKFLAYVLGRRPDEFGLVPDADGFVKIKDLLKALQEEDGFRHVRQAQINEILLTVPNAPIEIHDRLVRAKNRDDLICPELAEIPPKLLYICVRPKAYPHILEKGVSPSLHDKVILAEKASMARRMGQRLDADPVLLTVHTGTAIRKGRVFHRFGEHLFLTGTLSPDCLTGPPLPKDKKETPKKKSMDKDLAPQMAGSFLLKMPAGEDEKIRTKRERKRKEISWKKERKRMKRRKKSPKF